MINRTTRLDLLIYGDTKDINQGEKRALEYEGFALPEVDMRLKYLAQKGFVEIGTNDENEIVVTAITHAGHTFFKSLTN